jgi:hypothetical protein
MVKRPVLSRLNLTVLAAAFIILGPAAVAQSSLNVTSYVASAGPGGETPGGEMGERLAPRGKPLATYIVQSSRAVTLSEDVEVETGVLGRTRIKAGEVLFAPFDKSDRIYCAAARWAIKVESFPCLVDADGDGVFEADDWGGRPTTVTPLRSFGPRADRRLVDFAMQVGGGGRPMARPLKYQRVDASSGPPAEAQLRWETIRIKGQPKGALRLSVWLWAGATQRGAPIATTPVSVPLDLEGRGQLTVAGSVITVLGLSAQGGLRYRIAPPPPGALVRFVVPVAPLKLKLIGREREAG